MQRLVDAYNASGPAQRVVLSERDWSQGQAARDVACWAMPSKKVPLPESPATAPYTESWQGRAGAQDLQAQAFLVTYAIDSRGRLLALPVALATPVMYLNQQALRRSARNPSQCPRPGMTFQNLLGRLMDAGFACPAPRPIRTGSSSTTPAPGTMSRPFR